jgi:2-polyprenyl-3-methyl-5-hydroxy-6-metoxy-1,4-benzoquinol methylase
MMSLLKTAARFCTANYKELTGEQEQFCIRGGYNHRGKYVYWDDTLPHKDEYQKEVYARAVSLAKESQAKTIYDVGCGSGLKLMKHFRDYDTVGFDVPETLPFLQKTYPGRKWKCVPFSERGLAPADLVICADVIEHVPDPIELMEFIKAISSKWVVLSTPNRDIQYWRLSPHHFGPPSNPSHIREWSFSELEKFVAKFLTIKEHVVSNRAQATQMIVATVR